MSTTAASEFHAVDLDAVLDEFESSQTLEAAVVTTPPKIMTRESMIDHENTESGIKPNILEDLKAATSPSPLTTELQQNFEDDTNDNLGELMSDEQSNL